MKKWKDNITRILSSMELLSARDEAGREMKTDYAFRKLKEYTLRARELQKAVFLTGNGASASMASHMAADLAKNGHVRTEVFTDLSLITAIANDIGYEEVFSEPLRWKMKKGDMLVAVSSSGKSPNVLCAAEEARMKGGFVVTLSAMEPDNPLRSMGKINFYVPADTYGAAETCHAAVLHYWVDRVISETGKIAFIERTDITAASREVR